MRVPFLLSCPAPAIRPLSIKLSHHMDTCQYVSRTPRYFCVRDEQLRMMLIQSCHSVAGCKQSKLAQGSQETSSARWLRVIRPGLHIQCMDSAGRLQPGCIWLIINLTCRPDPCDCIYATDTLHARTGSRGRRTPPACRAMLLRRRQRLSRTLRGTAHTRTSWVRR